MSTTAAEEARMGMGAMPHESGIAFRVWAPHAQAASVVGSFNEWSTEIHPMAREGDGYWYADIASAAVGDEYRYHIVNGDQQLLRIDPYARQVTSSVGNAVVADPLFDWDGDDFHLPAVNELVIYELQTVCQVRASGRVGGDPGRRVQPLRSGRPGSVAV
jgi:1,4-alpha-glucan branching enzyme